MRVFTVDTYPDDDWTLIRIKDGDAILGYTQALHLDEVVGMAFDFISTINPAFPTIHDVQLHFIQHDEPLEEH